MRVAFSAGDLEALVWFTERVLPALREKVKRTVVAAAGSDLETAASLAALAAANDVRILCRPFLKRCCCFKFEIQIN
jgi:hypothetical protein